MNINSKLSELCSRLQGDWPELDAQLIVAHALRKPRTWVLAHTEQVLEPGQLEDIERAVSQLEADVPLPYVLGHWEFFGLDFAVTPDVLIPRPETEMLVEGAISWLQASPERRTVADVGTGSGSIGITLAVHVPEARVVATDVSLAALLVARRNARAHAVSHRMDFVACDLLPPCPAGLSTDAHFDLICANLPYIPTRTLEGLRVYGREPTIALDGGEDGLNLVRRLLVNATGWLAPNGRILLEIEASLGIKALSAAFDIFNEAEIHLHKDLTGRDRLLEIQL